MSGWALGAILTLLSLVWAPVASAEVGGDPHRLYRQHQVFGGAVITGNTLMTASITAPEVNSGLLPRSGGDVDSLPFDARIVAAYLFWSGSIANGTDRTVDLTAPGGGFFNDVAADRCVTVNRLGGFFYCRADVTNRLRQQFDGALPNGQYVVGDLDAEPGQILPDGTCAPEQANECQAKYAGWSMVLVYEAESANTLRDIFVYDGFRQLDETAFSPGVDTFDISGFDMPVAGQASLTYFAMEGDAFLGVPPQDTDANPQVRCDTCFDFLEFGGTKLTNGTNPPNNLFNSTSPGGFTLGLDIDTFNVSNLLRAGQQRVRIRAGSGDGRVNPNNPDPGGGGEMFMLGYVQLTVDRNAANFRRAGTQLTVVPDEAAPLERVVFTLRVENEGTLNAENVISRLVLPDGLTYLPGSLRVDGADPIPGDEVANPLAGGFNIGSVPFQGDNDRAITFRATIDQGVAAGTRLITRGTLGADGLEAVQTNEAVVVVLGDLSLGQVTKTVVDDGDGRFVPGEAVQYIITIPNPNPRNVNDVVFVDEVSRFLDVEQVLFAGQGENRSRGNSVRLESLVIPPGGLNVIILGRIHDTATLLADGVPPGGVNGFQISNQGQVTAAGQLIPTDDPSTAAANDPTRFRLSAEVDITGPATRKVGEDLNGGLLEPGDVVQYTITVSNAGAAPASIFIEDTLPEATEGCVVLPESQGNYVCANGRLQGFAEVPAGGRVSVVYTLRVSAAAADGTAILNAATIQAPVDPTQVTTVEAAPLSVVARPLLDEATKAVTRPDGTPLGGQALPGETLRYTLRVPNTGNRPATDLRVEDALDFDFDEVSPLDGGVYDEAANTVSWVIPEIQPGAEVVLRFDVTLPGALPDDTPIDNQAFVSLAELGEPVATDDPATAAVDDPTRVVVRSQPRLLLTKSVDRETARPGQVVTYTITVTNTGSDAAEQVVITDALPAGIFGELEAPGGRVSGRTATYSPADNPALGSLAVGASVTVQLRAAILPVLPPQAVDNQASVNADNVDEATLSDDPATAAPNDPTRFALESAPTLVAEKAVEDLNGGDPQPGDRVRYVITVSNTGDAPATEVSITDPVPPELTELALGAGGRLDGAQVIFSAGGPLRPGEAPAVFSFEATIAEGTPAGTRVSNQATALAALGEPALSDDPATPDGPDPTVLVVVSRPDLSTSTKRVEPAGPLNAGAPVRYVFEIRNTGTAPAPAVVLRDPLPALLVEPVAEGGGIIANGEARWALGELAPGEVAQRVLSGRVQRPAPDGASLSNQALLAIDGGDEVPTDDPTTEAVDDPTVSVVESRPELVFTKSVQDVDGAPVRPGDVLRYTLSLVNIGGVDAGAFSIEDVLDPNLVVEDAGGAEVNGNTLRWPQNGLAVDAPLSVSFTARVAAPLDNGTLIPNQASVVGLEAVVRSDDEQTALPDDPTVVQVVSGADPSGSTKTVEDLNGGDVRPGDRLRYTITVTNSGDAVARELVLRDPIPAALRVVSAPGSIEEAGVRVWPLAALPPGLSRTVEFEAEVVGLVPDGATVANQAFVALEGAATPFPTDDPSTDAVDDPTAVVVRADAEIALRKSLAPVAGLPIRPGDEVDYVIEIENVGDAISAPLEVRDPIPAELEVISAQAPAGVVGGELRWPVGALAPQASAVSVTLRARVREGVPDGVVVSNQATVQVGGAQQVSDDPATPQVGDPTRFTVVDEADLSGSTKSVDRDQVYGPGAEVTYTLVIRNRGSRVAPLVEVIDEIPEGLEVVSTEPPARLQGNSLLWALGDLGSDEEARLTLTARVAADTPDGTVISNQAFVQGLNLAAVPTDDPSTEAPGDPTAIEIVARPVLRLTKTVTDDDGGVFSPGDSVTWRLRLENTGTRATEALQVIDPIDPNLEGANAVDGAIAEGVARWQLPPLAAGRETELLLRARVGEGVADGTNIFNQFAVSAEGDPRFRLSDDPNTPEVDDPTGFSVSRPTLIAEKTVQALSPQGFAPGAPIRYTLRLRNEGEAPALQVLVADPIDTLRLDRIEAGEGGVVSDNGQVDWTPQLNPALRALLPGEEVLLTVDARVRPVVPAGEQVSNQGLVDVGGNGIVLPTDDPTVAGASDPTVFVVQSAPELRVEKRLVAPRPGERVPGAVVNYEIVVINEGQQPVVGPILTDNLPPTLQYLPDSTSLDGAPFSDILGAPPFGPGMLLATAGDPPALAPGEAKAVRFLARIRPDAPVGSEVPNQAVVSDRGGNTTFSDDPATAVEGDATRFVIDGAPDLSRLVKTWTIVGDPERREAVVGDVIEWRLELENVGVGEAREVSIVDEIPRNGRYVPGSIVLDGAPRTDAPDADGAQVGGGLVVANLGTVPGRVIHTLTFRTEATAGPELVNQGVVEAVGVSLLSDDDGIAENGRRPTVVPVRDVLRSAEIFKRIEGLEGDTIPIGETLRYRITARNTGNEALEQLVVLDDLQPTLIFEDFAELPPNARTQFEAPPAGEFGGGRARVILSDLAPEAEVSFVVQVRVDPELEGTRQICNEASLEVRDLDVIRSPRACVTAELRLGSVGGVVFQNLGDTDGYQGDEDETFAGMRVAAYPMSDADGPAAAEVVTDGEGRFELTDLRPGLYRLRVFTARDVLFHVQDDVQIVGGRPLNADLAIDPSGRVYNSVEGTLIDGAEIFIYRDEDPEDDDVLDNESLTRRVLVDPEDLEAPSQQGQRTANGGLYRFAVKVPGRYIVEVVPPGQSFVSPSILVPATPGIATRDDVDDEGRVVEDPLPSVAPDADRTYFLGFDLQTAEDLYIHNHIPVDPLSALIDLEKRSMKREVTVGDVVTYQVDIVNRSPTDLRFDPQTGTGGVFLQDIIPDGFKYVAGSAVFTRVDGGREIALSADDPGPDDVHILRFGVVRQEDGRNVLRPFDLSAGEHIRVRYQLVVGANTRPKKVYTNRAVLLADGTVPITDVARARVKVIADPIFDQGVLLGRVWCDTDGDGRQQEGERGLPGARVYMDHGWYAETDSAGLFHFRDIDPGVHAVKIDTDTLLPGALLTTDETRVINFTRGLPAKVGFGVTCPAEEASDAQLELDRGGMEAALEALRQRYVVITGDAQAHTLSDGHRRASAPEIKVKVAVKGERLSARRAREKKAPAAIDLNFDPVRGRARGGLVFSPTVPAGTGTDRWSLKVGPIDGPLTVVARGQGTPPHKIEWDLTRVDGRPLLTRRGVYAWRFEAAGADGKRYTSPLGRFGVGAMGPRQPELVRTLRGDLFSGRGRRVKLSGEAEGMVAEVALALNGRPGQITVEVHSAGVPGDEKAQKITDARAALVRAALAGALADPARVSAKGRGNDVPLVPNLTRRHRAKNERVEIRIIPAGPAEPPKSLVPGEPLQAWARAGRQEAKPGPDGRFAMVVPVPEDGVIEVALQSADGRRSVFVLRPAPGTKMATMSSRRLVVDGALPDGLRIGGAPISPRGLGVKVSGPEAAPLIGRRLEAPITFKLDPGPGSISRWRFSLESPQGKPVFEAGGEGAPERELVWEGPGDDSLSAGIFTHRLTVRFADGSVGQSGPGALKVGQVTTEPVKPKAEWSVRVDGRLMPQRPSAKGEAGAGRVDGIITVLGESAVLVEVRRPDGGRGLFFVQPPKAPEAGQARSGVPQEVPLLEPLPVTEEEAARAPKIPTKPKLKVDVLPDDEPAQATAKGTAKAAKGYEKVPDEAAREAKPLSPADRARMDAFGRTALLGLLISGTDAGQSLDVPARQLSATLPPDGAVLQAPTLPIQGRTHPENTVTVNGKPMPVDEAGAFSGVVELPIGEAELKITATDTLGNRGILTRKYTVANEQWFLLAMGEGLTGVVDAELDGVYDHTRTKISDRVYLHGRAVAYLKGRVQGKDILGGLFEQIKVTAHIDTARQREFESYFEQIIDPDTFYPVYGDSSKEVRDVNTRGPLYVLVQADRSTLTVGSFKTGIRGVELFNYDRALYGAHLKLDVETGDFRHEVTVFGSDEPQSERHAYVEMQGTGGSLYYLPHRDLVEGSERIYLVERDKISGVERRKVALSRDADYTIRYREGRILVKRPVQSTTLDVMGALPQVPSMNGGRTLDGHPVYVTVEYDHRDISSFGDQTFGVHARETWDDRLTLGAGYIEEGRSDRGLPDYRLWGAELTARHGRKSFVSGEMARSRSFNGENLFSDDGGLSFSPFNLRDGTNSEGSAFQLRLGVEVDDLVGEGKQDKWYTEGYWQYLSEGYYAGGTIQQQGLEKYGVLSRYHVDAHHQIRVQHDGTVASEPGSQNFGVFRGFRRDVTRGGYRYQEGALTLDAELVRTYADEGGLLNPQSPGVPTNGVFNGDQSSGINTTATGADDFLDPLDIYTLEVGGEYTLDERWTLIADQELVLRGDSRIHEESLDLLVTTAGARYQINSTVGIEGTVTSRWSGDNAAQVGMTAEVDEQHTVYVRDRRTDVGGQTTHTLVMGGEERVGEKGEGRAYGEYQVENSAEGQRNRAIMGVGRRMKLVPGLHLDVGYERSQVFGASAGGQFSRDTVSLGTEWLDRDKLKLTGRYELRHEDNDEAFNRRDRMQLLALNALSWKFQPDFSLLARLNYSHTLDLELEGTEAELVEGTLGIAWRPVRTDWAAALFRYTKRYEQLPVDLLQGLASREESDVVALIPIFELPYQLQIVEKLAYKRTATRAEGVPSVVSHTMLWINRLNYHLTDTWDIGGEYRFLQVSLAQNQLHGGLFELNYIIEKKVRLGLGYNFTSFSDNEFQRLDEDHGGPFFRVIANY